MMTQEEHALLTEVSDRLLDLYVERDEACKDSDWQRALLLQKAIEEVSEERRQVIEAAAPT
jgi:hypothetical protein